VKNVRIKVLFLNVYLAEWASEQVFCDLVSQVSNEKPPVVFGPFVQRLVYL